jgi:hypothetical protein
MSYNRSKNVLMLRTSFQTLLQTLLWSSLKFILKFKRQFVKQSVWLVPELKEANQMQYTTSCWISNVSIHVKNDYRLLSNVILREVIEYHAVKLLQLFPSLPYTIVKCMGGNFVFATVLFSI